MFTEEEEFEERDLSLYFEHTFPQDKRQEIIEAINSSLTSVGGAFNLHADLSPVEPDTFEHLFDKHIYVGHEIDNAALNLLKETCKNLAKNLPSTHDLKQDCDGNVYIHFDQPDGTLNFGYNR